VRIGFGCPMCNDTGKLDDAQAWDCGQEPSDCPLCKLKEENALLKAELDKYRQDAQDWESAARQKDEGIAWLKTEVERLNNEAAEHTRWVLHNGLHMAEKDAVLDLLEEGDDGRCAVCKVPWRGSPERITHKSDCQWALARQAGHPCP